MAGSAGTGRLVGQLVFLLVCIGFGVLTALRGDWFYVVIALAGCAGVLQAMRSERMS